MIIQKRRMTILKMIKPKEIFDQSLPGRIHLKMPLQYGMSIVLLSNLLAVIKQFESIQWTTSGCSQANAVLPAEIQPIA